MGKNLNQEEIQSWEKKSKQGGNPAMGKKILTREKWKKILTRRKWEKNPNQRKMEKIPNKEKMGKNPN